ncbi:MAG: hypothetical protein JO279_08725 [Verrucomicrobia bacterium]|nr:hypothetical protein [Verrucomicrobiota bacterium]
MESLPAFPFGQSDLATEEIFRQVIGLLDQAVSIIDLDSKRILYLSPVHERIWGRPLTNSLKTTIPGFSQFIPMTANEY